MVTNWHFLVSLARLGLLPPWVGFHRHNFKIGGIWSGWHIVLVVLVF